MRIDGEQNNNLMGADSSPISMQAVNFFMAMIKLTEP
uniref:Uncharacterized protein n=1 Tax=Rhizophora mucronata TaxID=61149 RepID=A0A2P2R032_RHIMU